MDKNKREDLFVIFIGVILAYFIYIVVINQLPGILADYNGHTYVCIPLFTGDTWYEGLIKVPHCMWHLCVLALNRLLFIPLEASAGYVSSFFHMSAYFITYWMIRRYTAAKGIAIGSAKAAIIALCLSVLQSLYFQWLDAGDRFLGSYSMNPIHNPTFIAVRPFILLCFCLVCDIWGAQKDENYQGIFFRVETGLKRYYICFAVLLLLSALAKPVFAEMFIPAAGLLMLMEWIERIIRKDGTASSYFKHCLSMLLCVIPTLFYILIQAWLYFILGGGSDGTIVLTGWMEVWGLFSDNAILSIALGMAFPLFIFLICSHFFVKEDMGKLALTGYLVSVLEAAVLGEEGDKFTHANFIWPMLCGMMLMWMTSTLHLLVLEKNQVDTKWKRILVDFAWFLFCIHTICGILYMRELIYPDF